MRLEKLLRSRRTEILSGLGLLLALTFLGYSLRELAPRTPIVGLYIAVLFAVSVSSAVKGDTIVDIVRRFPHRRRIAVYDFDDVFRFAAPEAADVFVSELRRGGNLIWLGRGVLQTDSPCLRDAVGQADVVAVIAREYSDKMSKLVELAHSAKADVLFLSWGEPSKASVKVPYPEIHVYEYKHGSAWKETADDLDKIVKSGDLKRKSRINRL